MYSPPVSDPRIIVAVMIDEPAAGQYYGGEVAAPVFSEVTGGALRALGVAPDPPLKSPPPPWRPELIEVPAKAVRGETIATTGEAIASTGEAIASPGGQGGRAL